MVTELARASEAPVNGRRPHVVLPAVAPPPPVVRRPVPVRRPPPPWEFDLARRGDPRVTHLAVDEIPAGLWVREPAAPAADDPANAIPVDPRRLAVVVSRPGGVPPTPAEVCRVVLTLPPALWRQLVVVPYGPLPGGEAFGAVVAAALGQEVPALTGLPLDTAGGRQVVAVAGDGRPSWRPFARELVYRPEVAEPPEVVDWVHPAPGLRAAGSEVVPVDSRWAAEIVAAGLWLRPTYRTDGAELVRSLPVDPARCLLVLGSVATHPVLPPAPVVQRLCDALPPDARAVLRLAVPAAGFRRARRWAWPGRDEPDGVDPLVLCDDGGLLPAAEFAGRLRRPRRSRIRLRTGPAGSSLVDTPTPPAPDLPAEHGPPPAPPPVDELPAPVAAPPEPPPVEEPAVSAAPVLPEPEPAPPPPPSEEPAAAAVPLTPVTLADVVQPVLPDLGRPSTQEERGRMRAWLGGRYDVFTPAVARLIAQRPGMRLAMEDRDGDALRAELTAVCAYLGDNLVPLDGDGDALRAYLSCAAAGLRRLPSYPGAMFCPAVDADMRWRRGAIVTAREFLTGTADVRVRFGDAEWVVWSTSGRRLDGLVAAPRRHEVVLGPGTGFAVLAVEPAADGRPARVFLGELPAGGARGDGTRWERMVERLRAAAERRDAVPEAERISAPEVRRPRLTAGAYLVERHDDSSEGPGRRAE